MKNFLLALMMVPLALSAQINCDDPNGPMQALICQNLEDTQTILALENDLADLQALLVEAQATIDSLTAAQDCGYEQFVIDELLDVNLELQADLVECDSVAIAEVEYWMNNYYGAVAEGNALVDSLQTELTAAQECCSSCPAAIEDAVNNAQAQAAEDLLPVLEALADAQECCSSCPAAIETAVDNAIAQCEENNAGELMEVYYNGYNAGLEDCEGEVSGLVDIDGTVINVIGYYNQLGQVIDPRTATGVIIRKHDDGTFSKYFR